jgi:hypothetical protein
MGYFTGHSPVWVSKTTNDKGKKLEDFLSQEGLCIFKNGTDTFLYTGNGSYSAIDLTVTDPPLLQDFSWKVQDDLCERPTRYQFDKSDWPLHEQVCREKLQTEIIRNATDPILKLNE